MPARRVSAGGDVRARRRERVEALGIDGLAGHLVDAVRALVEPLERGLDLGEVGLEPFEDREVLLALEHLGRLIGRMLVVVREVARLRGLLLVETLAAQLRDELPDPGPLALESLACRALVHAVRSWPEGYPANTSESLVETEARPEVDDPLGEQVAEQPEPGACVGGGQQPLRVERPDGRERGRLVRRAHRVGVELGRGSATRGSMRRASSVTSPSAPHRVTAPRRRRPAAGGSSSATTSARG